MFHYSSTSLIVIIEKYLVNNMHEECLFIQVRYNTAISPVNVIPTLQTCRIVYYILVYKPKFVALCFRLDQLIAYYCGRRNILVLAKFQYHTHVPLGECDRHTEMVSSSTKNGGLTDSETLNIP